MIGYPFIQALNSPFAKAALAQGQADNAARQAIESAGDVFTPKTKRPKKKRPTNDTELGLLVGAAMVAKLLGVPDHEISGFTNSFMRTRGAKADAANQEADIQYEEELARELQAFQNQRLKQQLQAKFDEAMAQRAQGEANSIRASRAKAQEDQARRQEEWRKDTLKTLRDWAKELRDRDFTKSERLSKQAFEAGESAKAIQGRKDIQKEDFKGRKQLQDDAQQAARDLRVMDMKSPKTLADIAYKAALTERASRPYVGGGGGGGGFGGGGSFSDVPTDWLSPSDVKRIRKEMGKIRIDGDRIRRRTKEIMSSNRPENEKQSLIGKLQKELVALQGRYAKYESQIAASQGVTPYLPQLPAVVPDTGHPGGNRPDVQGPVKPAKQKYSTTLN